MSDALNRSFGKLDSFIILYKDADSVNKGRVWAPVFILPLLVAAALFWHSRFSNKTRVTAVSVQTAILGIAVSLAVFMDPSTHECSRSKDEGFTTLVPSTFSPYSTVYPVAQALLIVIAGAGLCGYSPNGKARFILSILATFAGFGIALFFCSVNAAFERKNGLKLPSGVDFKIVFLDPYFLGHVGGLSVMVLTWVTKNFRERIRVIHGAVILYDLYKLCCINGAEAKLIWPHVFATPILLAINNYEVLRVSEKADPATPQTVIFTYPQSGPVQVGYPQPPPVQMTYVQPAPLQMAYPQVAPAVHAQTDQV